MHSLRYIFCYIAYGSCWIQLPLILLNPVLFISPCLVANDKVFKKYFLWQYSVNFRFILLLFVVVRLSPFAYPQMWSAAWLASLWLPKALRLLYVWSCIYVLLGYMLALHGISTLQVLCINIWNPGLFTTTKSLISQGLGSSIWWKLMWAADDWNERLGGSRGRRESGLQVIPVSHFHMLSMAGCPWKCVLMHL